LTDKELKDAVDYLTLYGDNDILPKLFEFEVIQKHFKKFISFLRNNNYYSTPNRNSRYIMLPKPHSNGFRVVYQMDPIHSILFYTYVRKISAKIEKVRIPIDREMVYSHRLNSQKSHHLYDNRYTYNEFLDRAEFHILNDEFKLVILTDISDFYLRIYHHDLENCLSDLKGGNSKIKTNIMKLLENITNNETIGVPIGPEPSHLLAELVLNQIDQLLLEKGIVFCRYSDDFCFICNNKHEAAKILEDFAETLYIRLKLTINAQKTGVYTVPEAIEKIENKRNLYIPYNPSEDDLKNYLKNKIGDDHFDNSDLSKLNYQDEEIIKSIDFSSDLLDIESLEIKNNALSCITKIRAGEYAELILDHIDDFSQLIRPLCKYFKSLDNPSSNHYGIIKNKMLRVLKKSIISVSKYKKMLWLNIYVDNFKLAPEDFLLDYYYNASDLEKREIIQIFGKLKNQAFFNNELKRIDQYCNPWVRRALLYGSQCVSTERRAFIRRKCSFIDGFDKLFL
jgi:hypothetical protein